MASESGWLVDLPWSGVGSAVYGGSRAEALALAEESRKAKVKELQNRIADIRKHPLAPYRAREGASDD